MTKLNHKNWRSFILFFALTINISAHSQNQSAAQPQKSNITLPSGASAKKVDEFLSTLRPPTNFNTLESGNDILLEFPDIAAPGAIRIKVTSTMPNTDGIWLLSLSQQPEAGNSLLASVSLTQNSLPEITLLLNLIKTQSILLVVRSNGKYYGLQREIKIGTPTGVAKK